MKTGAKVALGLGIAAGVTGAAILVVRAIAKGGHFSVGDIVAPKSGTPITKYEILQVDINEVGTNNPHYYLMVQTYPVTDSPFFIWQLMADADATLKKIGHVPQG